MESNDDNDEARPVTPFGDCPPGLGCLILTNKLSILEERDAGPMNHKAFKRYHIVDDSGDHLFFCGETKELKRTNCCRIRRDYSSMRPWTIEAFDDQDDSILIGSRSRMKTSCCFLKQNCKVTSFGKLIGRIQQVVKLYKDESTFQIMDTSGTPVVQIRAHQHLDGRLFSTKRCHEFPLMTMDNQACGKITWCNNSVWDPSEFGVEFPSDLDAKIKALLIYATFMIEFCYVQAVRQHRRN